MAELLVLLVAQLGDGEIHLLAFLVLGIAVSMVAFLLIVLPAVATVAMMAWFFQPRSG